MKKEDYDKINEYFNYLSLYMFKSRDIERYFIDIVIFSNMYIDYYIKKGMKPRYINTNHLSFNDVLLLSREVLSSINKDYLAEFDSLLNSGKLDFSYEEEYNDSHVYYLVSNNKIQNKLININRRFNYEDIILLIHEFMHYITSLLYNFDNKIISEFISIYFESYAYEYLYKNYNINKNEMNYDKRFFSIFANALISKTIDFPLLIYSSFGNLNEDSYKYGKQILNQYTKDMYNKEIRNAYKSINRFNDDYLYNSSLVSSHYYVLSTFLSFYARKKCEMSDMINLANNAKNEKVDIFELLNKYNINITRNMIYDIFESMDDYINIFENKKQR